MADIAIQFENTAKNRNELLCDLFESNGWHEDIQKNIEGGATITLKEVPLQKSIGSETLITIVLSLSTGVVSSLVANWLSKKFSSGGQTTIRVDQTQIEVTPENLVKLIQTTITIDKKS